MKWVMAVGGLVGAVVVGAIVVTFLQHTDVSETYVQTWPTAYELTTCAQWGSAMDDDQQFAASGDMLWEHLARNGATERPGRSRIVDYQGVVTQICDDRPGWSIARAGRDIGLPD